MDRQEILDLYEWQPGVCFRHPAKGTVATAVVGTIHPREAGERDVHACEECVLTMEDIRREEAGRSGGGYEPGHLGEVLQE
ncbi:hypothetical protein TUSST3_09960 [Streptomyces sp. TUS-ST3]|uniref:hypothetical protein n=1 Tax=Streptomyces sp. TUS-ST3 TaxID=3025591 RepID=UPI0024E0E4FD|nr:hypothetical protein [Streptomyces sp. TUS-ST3]GLP64376.1 hypothetical protein TUSST3_09960 [Streptomyces sp. TUS-ST3]